MTPEPEQDSPPLSVGPMTRRRFRDIPALAWLMACEFARPSRKVEPNRWLAGGMFPLFVAASLDAGVYRWDRLAVLTVHRTGLRLVLYRFAVAGWLAAAPAMAWVIAGEVGVSRYFAAAAGALLVYAACAFTAAHHAAVKHAEKKALESPAEAPTPRVDGPAGPRATWDISMGAAAPGLDAIHTLYGPLARELVPSGCTVDVVARNDYLAAKYEAEGFRYRPGRGRRMYLTLP